RRAQAGTRPSSLCIVGRPPPRTTLFPYTTLFRSQPQPFEQGPEPFRQPLRPLHRGSPPPRPSSGRRQIQKWEDVPVLPFQANFRSEEHTSELQSRENLVCRLLLEKKKNTRVLTLT